MLTDHLGRHKEAEKAYRRAIELDPTYGNPWNNLGILLTLHLGRHEEAEKAYRQAIGLDPTSLAPWNNLGNVAAPYAIPQTYARQDDVTGWADDSADSGPSSVPHGGERACPGSGRPTARPRRRRSDGITS